MQNNARALYIDPNEARARDFVEGIKRLGYYFDYDIAPTPTHGLVKLQEGKYQVMFYAGDISRDELGLFVRDAARIDGVKDCIAFLLCDAPGPTEDTIASVLGCAGVVGRQWIGSDQDKLREALAPLEKRLSEWEEVKEKFIDVHDAVQLLIREVDCVARDRKRGAGTNFNTIAPDFLEMMSEMSNDLKDRYYSELMTATKEIEPEGFNKLEVSEDILKRELPRLTKDSYSGVSRRVWTMLSKRFGAEDEEG